MGDREDVFFVAPHIQVGQHGAEEPVDDGQQFCDDGHCDDACQKVARQEIHLVSKRLREKMNAGGEDGPVNEGSGDRVLENRHEGFVAGPDHQRILNP